MKNTSINNIFLFLLILFFLFLILFYFYKLLNRHSLVESFDDKSTVIPLNIYQTWNSHDTIPPKMKEIMDSIKTDNPEFNYKCYNNNDCIEFIKNNFDETILDAYNRIIPASYRSDLWRYCVLYINGGIYLDTKMKPVNGFKFLSVTDKEYFVRDFNTSGKGVVTCFVVSKPKNDRLLKAINAIVDNVNNNFYGESSLSPTGPLLLKRFFTDNEIDNLDLEYCFNEDSSKTIISRVPNSYKDAILERDDVVYSNQNKIHKRYNDYWNERSVYLPANKH